MDVILQIGDQTQRDREVNIPFLLEETPTEVRTPMSIDAKSMTVKLHPGKTKVALIKRPADYDGNMHPVRIVKFTHSDAGYEENMTNHVSSALLPGKKPNTLTTTVGFRSNVAPTCRFEVDFDYKTGEVTVTDLGTDGETLKTVDLEYGYIDDRFDGITNDPTDEQPQKALTDRILSQHPVATIRECFLPIRENLQLDLPANRVQPYDAVSEGARILEVYTQDGVRIPVHFYPSSVLVANPSDDSGLTIQAALTVRPTAVDNVPNGDKIHLMVRINVKTGVVSLSQDVVGSVSLKAVLLKYAVFEDFEAFFHEDDKQTVFVESVSFSFRGPEGLSAAITDKVSFGSRWVAPAVKIADYLRELLSYLEKGKIRDLKMVTPDGISGLVVSDVKDGTLIGMLAYHDAMTQITIAPDQQASCIEQYFRPRQKSSIWDRCPLWGKVALFKAVVDTDQNEVALSGGTYVDVGEGQTIPYKRILLNAEITEKDGSTSYATVVLAVGDLETSTASVYVTSEPLASVDDTASALRSIKYTQIIVDPGVWDEHKLGPAPEEGTDDDDA